MCGRFTLRTPAAAWTQQLLPLWSAEEVAARLAALEQTTGRAHPRYNIAPTQLISCVLGSDDGHRRWEQLRWGLIPPWADDPAIGNRMINARSETAHEKRSFKSPLAKRRCLIPADGYFEWMKTDDGKQPYLIERKDGGLISMAGLWECNKKLEGQKGPLCSVTILTTAANQTTKHIHHRMPVIVEPKDHHLWLDPQVSESERFASIFTPVSDDLLSIRAVSKFVNSPRNDSPKCVEDAATEAPQPQQGDLF